MTRTENNNYIKHDAEGRLPYRTATKSTLICFHLMQKRARVRVRLAVRFGSLSDADVAANDTEHEESESC